MTEIDVTTGLQNKNLVRNLVTLLSPVYRSPWFIHAVNSYFALYKKYAKSNGKRAALSYMKQLQNTVKKYTLNLDISNDRYIFRTAKFSDGFPKILSLLYAKSRSSRPRDKFLVNTICNMYRNFYGPVEVDLDAVIAPYEGKDINVLCDMLSPILSDDRDARFRKKSVRRSQTYSSD